MKIRRNQFLCIHPQLYYSHYSNHWIYLKSITKLLKWILYSYQSGNMEYRSEQHLYEFITLQQQQITILIVLVIFILTLKLQTTLLKHAPLLIINIMKGIIKNYVKFIFESCELITKRTLWSSWVPIPYPSNFLFCMWTFQACCVFSSSGLQRIIYIYSMRP